MDGRAVRVQFGAMNAIRIAFSIMVSAIAASALACPSPAPVSQDSFVPIGGIEQWVTVRGTSCANPVVLFLHGGPGNPLSPYGEAIYQDWEKDFTVVQWDQRGSGRTFARNPATAKDTLSIERMTRDGIEVAQHLARRFGQKKIYLVGGSWGSVLGVHMAKTRPDLFRAYVGVGQLVSYRHNQSASYARVLKLARSAGDKALLERIEALGPPPWTNPRSFGILRRATRVFEGKTSLSAPEYWWVPAEAYATKQAEADYEAGEEYSYIQFVGMKGQGMFSRVDLNTLGRRFEVPMYFIQGAEDLVTTPDVARAFFDRLSAPRKDFVLLERTGHDPNALSVDAVRRILKTDVARRAKAKRP